MLSWPNQQQKDRQTRHHIQQDYYILFWHSTDALLLVAELSWDQAIQNASVGEIASIRLFYLQRLVTVCR